MPTRGARVCGLKGERLGNRVSRRMGGKTRENRGRGIPVWGLYSQQGKAYSIQGILSALLLQYAGIKLGKTYTSGIPLNYYSSGI